MENLPKRIEIESSWDGSRQPARFRPAAGDGPRPLLVALHTWSFDCDQDCSEYDRFCRENGWHFIFPNFRGPNWRPGGLGSDAAVADIVDAVHFARKRGEVDSDRIYLIGGSGGGHAALLLAGRHPEIWAAVSAWCPISDVAAWYRQCHDSPFQAYANHIEVACGGNPITEKNAAFEAERRSPLTYLAAARELPVDIATGIHDGHAGSVPVSQALEAFNLLAAPEDRFSREEITCIVRNEKVPSHFPEVAPDPAYGDIRLHLRRVSGKTRITLFEGAHDLLNGPGLRWLAEQRRNQEVNWNIAAGVAGAATLGK